jgi:peptidoglycan/xylan/chitin deacetylase (PgdA/CDA1 family)
MSLKGMVYRVAAGGLPLFSRLSPRRYVDNVGIIMVHGVYHRGGGSVLPAPRGSVFFLDFEANLLSLARTYTFLSMDEFVGLSTGATSPRKRCLVLTFDDSLKCHTQVVAPKLAAWGIPAIFYLSTGTIETRRPYWWLRLEYALSRLKKPVSITLPDGQRRMVDSTPDVHARRSLTTALRSTGKPAACEKVVEAVEAEAGVDVAEVNAAYPYAEPMTWDDARELVRLGMTVGSHTVSHPNLSLLNAEELRSEFTNSRQTLERECRTSCRHLCYPHGFYSESVCEEAKGAGYLSGVTADGPGWNGPGTDLFRLERFAMPEQPYKLPYMLTGAESLINWLKPRVAAHG